MACITEFSEVFGNKQNDFEKLAGTILVPLSSCKNGISNPNGKVLSQYKQLFARKVTVTVRKIVSLSLHLQTYLLLRVNISKHLKIDEWSRTASCQPRSRIVHNCHCVRTGHSPSSKNVFTTDPHCFQDQHILCTENCMRGANNEITGDYLLPDCLPSPNLKDLRTLVTRFFYTMYDRKLLL